MTMLIKSSRLAMFLIVAILTIATVVYFDLQWYWSFVGVILAIAMYGVLSYNDVSKLPDPVTMGSVNDTILNNRPTASLTDIENVKNNMSAVSKSILNNRPVNDIKVV